MDNYCITKYKIPTLKLLTIPGFCIYLSKAMSENLGDTSREKESSASVLIEQTLPVTANNEQSVDVALARKRKSWREASMRYRLKPEGVRARLDKDKARSAKLRSRKSMEDMDRLRKQIRELKSKRIRQESKNERFWRLLTRWDERRFGCNSAFGWEIDMARGSGLSRHDKDEQLPSHFLEPTVRSEEMVKIRNEFREEFEKFYDMLRAVKNGLVKIDEIPESFDDFFRNRQLSMTSSFVKSYLS